VSSDVGAAALDVWSKVWRRIRRRLVVLVGELVELATPHPPVTLVSLDGETVLTGLALLREGQVLAFIGSRSAPNFRRSAEQSWPRYGDSYHR
jgi:hypothetical protein